MSKTKFNIAEEYIHSLTMKTSIQENDKHILVVVPSAIAGVWEKNGNKKGKSKNCNCIYGVLALKPGCGRVFFFVVFSSII